MDRGQKVASEFVVSSGDAPKILEPAEAALNDVASFVGALIEAVDDYSVGFVRDDGGRAAANDLGAETVAVIAFVSDESAHRRSQRQNGRRGGNVCVLAGREMKYAGPAIRIAQRVDFRGASAAGAADRLRMLPPFPPLAERCALIEVESSDNVTESGPQLTKASNIARQRPRLAHLLKRL
jgi:hypothetical protein